MRALCVCGTRPEAIKMAPVVRALRRRRVETRLCVTGQHRELLHEALSAVELRPDRDLRLMRPRQSLEGLTARIVDGVAKVIEAERPDVVVVQGDTTTAFGAALAAYYHRVPIAHVEAGLRTGDLYRPFPEEGNRALVDRISKVRLAPTRGAAENLWKEGIQENVYVTGNPVVDSVKASAPKLAPPRDKRVRGAFAGPPPSRTLLFSVHRRESFGRPIAEMSRALVDLLQAHPGLRAVALAHPNPDASAPLRKLRHPRLLVADPLPYGAFLWCVRAAALVLSDSGGVQEEAPSLHAPVCVLRELTERPEAVQAGCAVVAGVTRESVFRAADRLLRDPELLQSMREVANPFGDGRAGERIAAAVLHAFGKGPKPKDWRH